MSERSSKPLPPRWLVRKVVVPLGEPFYTYLRHPRRSGVEGWDERHDARAFSFWGAVWQCVRHPFSWPVRA